MRRSLFIKFRHFYFLLFIKLFSWIVSKRLFWKVLTFIPKLNLTLSFELLFLPPPAKIPIQYLLSGKNIQKRVEFFGIKPLGLAKVLRMDRDIKNTIKN